MKSFLVLVLISFSWLSFGCVDSHSNIGPASCFDTAYGLAIKGQYDQTAEYFTDDILNYLKTNKDVTLEKIWADRLNNGTVKGVKIIERQTDPKNCDIKFMILGSDGQMVDAEDTLVFERGMWKFDKMKRVR